MSTTFYILITKIPYFLLFQLLLIEIPWYITPQKRIPLICIWESFLFCPYMCLCQPRKVPLLVFWYFAGIKQFMPCYPLSSRYSPTTIISSRNTKRSNWKASTKIFVLSFILIYQWKCVIFYRGIAPPLFTGYSL